MHLRLCNARFRIPISLALSETFSAARTRTDADEAVI